MIPAVVYLFPLNNNWIQVAGLENVLDGSFLNAATVMATLINYRGIADPVLNNIPMTYIPASNGNYEGVAPDTFNAPVGSGYILQIQATQGSVQGLWSIPAQVKQRAA